MRKIIRKFLMVALFSLQCFGIIRAADYYASPTGSSSNTGTLASPWDIHYAVGSASPLSAGDVLHILSGTYTMTTATNNQVKVQKSGVNGNPITIIGEGNVEIIGNYYDHTWARGTFDITSLHDIIVDNITVKNAGFVGILISGCSRVTVQNCSTIVSWASGIGAYPAPGHYPDYGVTSDPNWVVSNYDIKVLNCYIEQAQYGVISDGRTTGVPLQEALDMWGVDGFEVAYNTLLNNHKEGIDCKDGTRNGTIHHNRVMNQNPEGKYVYNGIGIYLDGAHGNMYNIEVYNNEISNKNGVTYANARPAGIGISDEKFVYPGNSVSDIKVYNNIIYNVEGMGMYVYDGAYNVDIYNNTIVDCGGFGYDRGIYIDEGWQNVAAPHDIRIFNNIFRGNNYRQIDVGGAVNVEVAYNLISGPGEEMGTANYHDNTIVPETTPLFVAETGTEFGNDFHLLQNSPAINIGNALLVSSFDFENNARPANGGYDVGAFEYGGISTLFYLTVNSGSGSGSYPEGNSVNITANAAPVGQGFDKWIGDIATVADVYAASTTVTIPAYDIDVTATYKTVPTYPLTVNNGSGSGSYTEGNVVNITANAAPAGHVFDAWTGDIAYVSNVNASSTSVTMPAVPVSITANYKAIPTYTLTVNITGQGSVDPLSGSVYNAGTVVAITATPAAGWQLASAPESVTMDSNKTIDVVFEEVGYVETIRMEAEDATFIKATIKSSSSLSNGKYVDGNNGFNITWNYSAPVADNYLLKFAVAAPSGTRSMGVFVNNVKIGVMTTSSPVSSYELVEFTASLVVGSNIIELRDTEGANEPNVDYLEITGSMATPTTYSLTINVTGLGTVTPSAGVHVYNEGTIVDISAVADSGYEFIQWSDGSTTNHRTIVMNADVTLLAIFEEQIQNYTLTVISNNGTVSPAGGTYAAGTQVCLTATADACYAFASWSGDAAGATNPVCIIMDGNKIINANYSQLSYNLTVNASTGGSVTPANASGTYNCGTSVTIEAVANNGYTFTQWSDGNTTNPRTITILNDLTLNANFVESSSCGQILSGTLNLEVCEPYEGQTYNLGDPIVVKTNFSSDITKVNLWKGDWTWIGDNVVAPFEITWNNATVGSQTIIVRGNDGSGTRTSNLYVNIIVVDPSKSAEILEENEKVIEPGQIFPNPVSKEEFLNIQGYNGMELTITTLAGKTVYRHQNVSNIHQIEPGLLKGGIYLLHFRNDLKQETKKLVVK